MRIEDIVDEITKLEQSEPSWNNVQKLSWLYTVRDHLEKPPVKAKGFASPEGGSEFRQCTGGKDVEAVMIIIDELMETTHILNPRLYEAVIERMNEL